MLKIPLHLDVLHHNLANFFTSLTNKLSFTTLIMQSITKSKVQNYDYNNKFE